MMRILAISPRFAPSNGADMHRLRLLAAHAEAAGWQLEILAVWPEDVDNPVDPWLADRLPSSVMVHRVAARASGGWGLNGLAQRSLLSLWRTGNHLLATGRFDLVFFSTTEFAVHLLGPLWRRRHGVPFCMDYQDPWVNDYYRRNPEVVPPGGRLKYAIADRLHRVMEAWVVREAGGFLSVSADYLSDLSRRYGSGMARRPSRVLSFPGEPAEFLGFTDVQPDASCWRYIGRGGADMAKAARAFFLAWSAAGLSSVRFEAHGTAYSSQGAATLAPLAADLPVAGWVSELPQRMGYSDLLRTLRASGALVVFGSDDPAYTASKIYPYLLSGRPLLAIFHEQSSVVPLMRTVGGGVCVTFNETTSVEALALAICEEWFNAHAWQQPVPLDAERFYPWTAQAQAHELASWFREILA